MKQLIQLARAAVAVCEAKLRNLGQSYRRLELWAFTGLLATFSQQIYARNKLTDGICSLKSYLFEDALLWALGGMALIGVGVGVLLDSNDKAKAEAFKIIIVIMIVLAIPEAITRLGGVNC